MVKKTDKPLLKWMLDMRQTSRTLIDLLMEKGRRGHVQRIEEECQIDHFARDVAMVISTLNEWIIKHEESGP